MFSPKNNRTILKKKLFNEKNVNYKQVIEEIFSFELSNQNSLLLRDCEYLDPAAVYTVASNFDLIPEKEKVVRVAGSFGKTTTVDIIGNILRRMDNPGKVATLFSSDKMGFIEQIQINGVPISENQFLEIYTKSKAIKQYVSRKPTDSRAFPTPRGILLLIALKYFQEQKVDYIVLEAKRGFRFDETYYFKSAVGVVTSLYEHQLSEIGPTMQAVFNNTLAICDYSDIVIVPEGFVSTKYSTETFQNLRIIPRVTTPSNSISKFSDSNVNLSKGATRLLTRKVTLPQIDAQNLCSHQVKIGNKNFYLEGIISKDNLDTRWIKNLGLRKTVVITCLPENEALLDLDYALAKEKIEVRYVHDGIEILHSEEGDPKIIYNMTSPRVLLEELSKLQVLNQFSNIVICAPLGLIKQIAFSNSIQKAA